MIVESWPCGSCAAKDEEIARLRHEYQRDAVGACAICSSSHGGSVHGCGSCGNNQTLVQGASLIRELVDLRREAAALRVGVERMTPVFEAAVDLARNEDGTHTQSFYDDLAALDRAVKETP